MLNDNHIISLDKISNNLAIIQSTTEYILLPFNVIRGYSNQIDELFSIRPDLVLVADFEEKTDVPNSFGRDVSYYP